MSDEALFVIEEFAELGKRFQGVDLQFRRTTNCGSCGWPAPWRARLLTSKAEREEYRMNAYGRTPFEAISKLLSGVAAIESSGVPRLHSFPCPARFEAAWRKQPCTCKAALK